MYKIKKTGKFSLMFSIMFCLLFCTGIFLYPMDSVDGAAKALSVCGNALIPSLFPFMFIASFAVNSPVSRSLAFVAGPFARLFGLPKNTAVTIILSLTGGYPVGARGIRTLYTNNEISKEQAEFMSYFCIGAGPGFLLGTVGSVMYGNSFIGFIIFLAQIPSAVILGLALRLLNKNNTVVVRSNSVFKSSAGKKSFAKAFTESCSEASSAMLTMSALVILFGSITALLRSCGFIGLIDSLFHFIGFNNSIGTALTSAIFEVTSGCKSCIDARFPVEAVAFAVGWGGLCVHFQVWAILGDIKINKFKFILCRLVQGILSGVFTYILFFFFPVSQSVFKLYSTNVELTSGGTIAGGIALIIMCIIFLVSLERREAYTGKR